MDEEKILEKVRRLFELAKSPNIHEAEAAMLKAQELLHKYQLSEHAVPKDERQPFVREFMKLKNKEQWASILMNTLAKYNGAYLVHDRDKDKGLALMGQRHAIEIVVYGYQQMEAKIRWLADVAWDIEEDHRSMGERQYKAGYALGAVNALSEKLRRNEADLGFRDTAESKALVVQYNAELNRAVAGWYPNLVKRSGPTMNADAYGAGKRAGRFLDVNPGLNGGAVGMRRLS